MPSNAPRQCAVGSHIRAPSLAEGNRTGLQDGACGENWGEGLEKGGDTEVLNGGAGGGYPKSGPKLNFNGSGAS